MAFTSVRVQTKATRLILEGKVREEHDAIVFEVEGDTACYSVIAWQDGSVTCNCIAGKLEDRVGFCAHALAVHIIIEDRKEGHH